MQADDTPGRRPAFVPLHEFLSMHACTPFRRFVCVCTSGVRNPVQLPVVQPLVTGKGITSFVAPGAPRCDSHTRVG